MSHGSALVSALLVLAGASACTSASTPPGPIQLTTPRLHTATALTDEHTQTVVWASARELALTRGLDAKAIAAAERPSWTKDESMAIPALSDALGRIDGLGDHVALVIDAELPSDELIRVLVTLRRAKVEYFDFVLGWPPAAGETATVARTAQVHYRFLAADEPQVHDSMSGPGVLRLHFDHARVKLTTMHGEGVRGVPVNVDEAGCELPSVDAHAALVRVAEQLCAANPQGFYLALELDRATPFANIVELFAVDPRPERCRASVVLEAPSNPTERSCEGARGPEGLSMAPWPLTLRAASQEPREIQ